MPQILNVRIHNPLFSNIIKAPDLIQQLTSRQNLSVVLHQRLQQFKFRNRQFQLPSLPEYHISAHINPQISIDQLFAPQLTTAAQQRFNFLT